MESVWPTEIAKTVEFTLLSLRACMSRVIRFATRIDFNVGLCALYTTPLCIFKVGSEYVKLWMVTYVRLWTRAGMSLARMVV